VLTSLRIGINTSLNALMDSLENRMTSAGNRLTRLEERLEHH
jgi:hypothetical protein